MSDRKLENRRILVVEDEYFLADDIRETLCDAGAEVLGPVPSVAEARALVEAGTWIDLAVLDINLQGEEVFPVADLLRIRGVPFVFATGYDGWAIPERFADTSRLEKPQVGDNLLAAIEALIAS
jgi:DNA-binding response OmpR family regulator